LRKPEWLNKGGFVTEHFIAERVTPLAGLESCDKLPARGQSR
jgi:hypothetical protein